MTLAPEPLSPRALERRLKRRLLKAEARFYAPCAPGFEDVLAAEVARLPHATLGERETGGVSFAGPLETLYHANLRLHTAHRVLLRIEDFQAQNEPTLYDRVRRVPWELYLGFQNGYRLRVSAKRSRLNHERAIAETVAAGVRSALEPLGLAPVPRADAPLSVHLRLLEDRCTLSLDTSGEHLHKRGYRVLAGAAPLRETLAAAVLLAAGWAGHDLVLDPMCGSGTLLIEAALLATNTAPGAARTFAFEQAPFFQAGRWARLRREAAAERRPPRLRLLGSDRDASALELAAANAAAAGVAGAITLRREDALVLEPPAAERPLLMSNLPYGARLGAPREAAALGRAFAARLAGAYGGWDYALVSPNARFLADVGLEPLELRAFRNGGLPVTLARGRVP